MKGAISVYRELRVRFTLSRGGYGFECSLLCYIVHTSWSSSSPSRSSQVLHGRHTINPTSEYQSMKMGVGGLNENNLIWVGGSVLQNSKNPKKPKKQIPNTKYQGGFNMVSIVSHNNNSGQQVYSLRIHRLSTMGTITLTPCTQKRISG